MPTKKERLKPSKSARPEKRDAMLEAPAFPDSGFSPRPKRPMVYIVILAVVLGLVFLTNKGLFLAAVVDGKPIFRWELNKVLISRFGKQTLEGMISERLVSNEAQKAGVRVTTEEINAKEQEVIKSLGENVKLEDLLKFQGMTKEDFDSQIRLRMTVERILGKNFNLTETDIDMFIATNRALLVATEPAALREEAKQAIMSQKITAMFQSWFAELKDKAKILRFL